MLTQIYYVQSVYYSRLYRALDSLDAYTDRALFSGSFPVLITYTSTRRAKVLARSDRKIYSQSSFLDVQINPDCLHLLINDMVSLSAPIYDTMIQYGQITHPGLVRDHNEDNYLVDEELRLWVIADGMGGHACGEVASQIVVDLVHDKIKSGHTLQEAVEGAHEIVLVAAAQHLGMPGMGSTVVAACIHEDHFEIAWVGDSRAYLWENGKLRQITRDHSFVQQMVDAGALSVNEARRHPHRNIVTQAIGASDLEKVEAGTSRIPLKKGQQVLLCSDGLSDEVTQEEISMVLSGSEEEQIKVNQLLELALVHGGADNITILLISAPEDIPVLTNTIE